MNFKNKFISSKLKALEVAQKKGNFSKLSAFHVLARYETVLNMLMKGIYGHQEDVDMGLLSFFVMN